jgi:opacity protein-like surface antigen
VDVNAQKIANFIGGTFTPVQKANFGDAGVRYRFPVLAKMIYPYIGFGVGVAKVDTDVTFFVNGTDVTDQLPNRDPAVTLGNDLSSNFNKTFVTIPIGVHVNVWRWVFVDGSYRWGRILKRADDDLLQNDVPIPAQRLQFGIGLRY